MRVAQILDSLKVGGAQTLQITFAQAAAKSGDLELSFISLQDSGSSPIPEHLRKLGSEVITLPARKILDPSRLRLFARWLREKQIDVVQTHLTTANIVGGLAAWLAGIPVVATLHSAGVDKLQIRRSRRALESLMLRTIVSRVVAVGSVVAHSNQSRVCGKPIHVIRNAVLPMLPPEAGTRAETRQGLLGDAARELLISVGRLSPAKGYPDLLKAFQIIHRSHPSAVLAIAGGGLLQQELEHEIRALGLIGHVHLLGFRDDIPRLLQAADIYLSSSHWEGLPVSVLEAMAAGLPVIGTAVGDLPEVVKPDAGILSQPGRPDELAHATLELLRNPERRCNMGRCAREHVTRMHSPEAWLNEWIDLYRGLAWRANRPGMKRAV